MAKISYEKAVAYLARVPQGKEFFCHGGSAFGALQDLARGLSQMSDEAFLYHADDHKNDFAYWVRDVIGDLTMANLLYRCHTRAEAQRMVQERVSTLRKVAGEQSKAVAG